MENTKDLDRMLEKLFVNEFRTGYVTKEGVCLPKYYETFEEGIKNFQVRDDDVWVCSFPKTGELKKYSNFTFFTESCILFVSRDNVDSGDGLVHC